MGGAGLVVTNSEGKCAGLDANGEFLEAVDSCNSATQWVYDSKSQHVFSLAAGNHKWGQGRCLTAVEPNPLVVAAMALRIVDSSGTAVPVQSSLTSSEQHHSSLTMSLDAFTGPVTMLTAIITKGNCTGCESDVNDPEATAVALVDTHAQDSATAVGAAHALWWQDYWGSGAKVDLGIEWNRLESFYYGMHYQIGSASRADRFAPGLWGPWITDETCGWSGDYTLNYNFEVRKRAPSPECPVVFKLNAGSCMPHPGELLRSVFRQPAGARAAILSDNFESRRTRTVARVYGVLGRWSVRCNTRFLGARLQPHGPTEQGRIWLCEGWLQRNSAPNTFFSMASLLLRVGLGAEKRKNLQRTAASHMTRVLYSRTCVLDGL